MALIPGTTDMSVPESGERPASGSAAVWTALVSVLKAGLAALGYAEWAVLRNYNPVTENFRRPVITMQRISMTVSTWNAGKDITVIRNGAERFMHVESTIENTVFRISAFSKRDITGITEGSTEPDPEAWDVLCGLRLWLWSDAGISMLRQNGLCPVNAVQVNGPVIISDNDVFETIPAFDMTVQVIRETDTEQAEFVSAEGQKIKGV